MKTGFAKCLQWMQQLVSYFITDFDISKYVIKHCNEDVPSVPFSAVRFRHLLIIS
jgi:hypothetical protein